MVPKIAIEAYLETPRDDHRWMKLLDEEEVDKSLRKLSFTTFPQSRLHQKVGNLLGVAYPQFAFYYDMGTGKTLMTLDILRYWMEVGRVRRALVLLTSDKAMPTWIRQKSKFGFSDIPHTKLVGSSEEKWDRSRDIQEGILFVSYPGAVNMLAHKAKGSEWSLSLPKLEDFSRDLDAIVMDESTRAGNRSSLTHTMCRYFAHNKAEYCYALAGRPFGRDPHLLWGQMDIVDGGETFGPLGLFREAFFSSKQNKYARKHGRRGKHVKDFTFLKRKLPQLRTLMQHRSLTYTSDECIQLPPVSDIIEEVELPAEALPYYRQVAEELRRNRTNMRVVNNAFLRLRQISSGFLGFVDDLTGDKLQVEFKENPKLDLTLELLQDIPADRKAIVFYEFTFSGRKIVEGLKKLGIDSSWMWSGTKNGDEEQERFINDPDYNVMVINNKVGAYSLDGLQVANYQLFYESPVSVIDRDQAERRVEREGQLFKIFRYDIIMRGTVDERILDFHAEGRDIYEALKQNPLKIIS